MADRRPAPVATPTWTGGLLLTAGFAALLLAGVAGSRWLQLVGVATVALVLVSWLTAPGPARGVTVRCARPPRAAVGDAVPMRLRLHNPARRSSARLLVRLRGDLTDPVVVDVAPVPRRSTAGTRFTTTAVRRGLEDGLRVELVAQDALGLFRRRWTADLAAPLVVHPAPVPVRVPRPDAAAADAERLRGADGDPFALRDWVSGDEGRAVNWRATARRGRLVVTERAARSDRTLHVALPGGLSDLAEVEAEIARSASLSVAALRAGLTVTVSTPVARAPHPVATPLAALDWWAAVDADAVRSAPAAAPAGPAVPRQSARPARRRAEGR